MDGFLAALRSGDLGALQQYAVRFGPQFLGGAIGFLIVVLFLALRGGDWSREEDVHLLIVVNGAIAVSVVVSLGLLWARFRPRAAAGDSEDA